MKRLVSLVLFAAATAVAVPADAACVNKYVHRKDGQGKITLTVITGKLTFAEAQKLVADVAGKKTEIEWTDKDGKTIVKALAGASAVRPMPVACDGRKSGSVLSASFLRPSAPSGTIYLKLGNSDVIAFDEQKN